MAVALLTRDRANELSSCPEARALVRWYRDQLACLRPTDGAHLSRFDGPNFKGAEARQGDAASFFEAVGYRFEHCIESSVALCVCPFEFRSHTRCHVALAERLCHGLHLPPNARQIGVLDQSNLTQGQREPQCAVGLAQAHQSFAAGRQAAQRVMVSFDSYSGLSLSQVA